MQRLETTSAFFTDITDAFRNAPRALWAGFVAMGVFSAALETAPLAPLGYVGAVLFYLLSFAMLYVASMVMLRRALTWTGLGKFLATLALMVSPIVFALILAVTSRETALFIIVIPLLLLAIFAFSFLQGWPVLQAASAGWTGPVTAWQATKGIRWQLFVASALTSAINRAGPDVAKANGALEKAFALAVEGFVTCLGLALAASVAAQAGRFMQDRLAQTEVAPAPSSGD